MEPNNSLKQPLRTAAVSFLVLVAFFICYGAIRANFRKSREAAADSDPAQETLAPAVPVCLRPIPGLDTLTVLYNPSDSLQRAAAEALAH